jgi:hypothetical protein
MRGPSLTVPDTMNGRGVLSSVHLPSLVDRQWVSEVIALSPTTGRLLERHHDTHGGKTLQVIVDRARTAELWAARGTVRPTPGMGEAGWWSPEPVPAP